MAFEFSPSKSVKSMSPLLRKGAAASLAKTSVVSHAELMKTVPPKHGFGIEEFLEEFKSVANPLSESLKKAATCKVERERLYLLMQWAEKLHENVSATRESPRFEGKTLFQLELIINKLILAFNEEVKKPSAETKVSKSKFYDFGLKKFLERYSSTIPEELKHQFTLIHKVHNQSSDEINILDALVVWVREVQKEFRCNRDASIMLETIKFRLRVGLAVNRALESASHKISSLTNKKKSLSEKLHKVNSEKAATNSALAKISEEILHQNISHGLLQSLAKLSESDSAIEMPVVVCETKAEKALVDKIQKYIKRHDERVKSFPVVTYSIETETVEISKELQEISQESYEEEEFLRLSYSMRAKRSSDEKFGLSSPSLIKAPAGEEPALSVPKVKEQQEVKKLHISRENLKNESLKIMEVIKKKKDEISRLRNKNVECARRVETFKTQMFRSMPDVTKSKTVKDLKSIDQHYQQYKNAQHQDGKDAEIKEAAMTWWDRICEKFGLALSARHVARKTEVQKYFQSLDARAQLEAGLQTGNDGKIASSFNNLNVPEGYFNLWKSLCEIKNKVSENTASGNKILDEIEEQQERLKQIQAEQKQQADLELDLKDEQAQGVDAKTKEPLESRGFMLEL